MNKEFFVDIHENDNFRITLHEVGMVEIEEYDCNNSLRTSIMISTEAFDTIIKEYTKWKEAEEE